MMEEACLPLVMNALVVELVVLVMMLVIVLIW